MSEHDPAARASLPGWKKSLLVLSFLVGIGGLGLAAFGGKSAAPPDPGARALPGGGGGSSLMPGGAPTRPTAEPAPEDGGGASEWGPPLSRFGFSFFAGFSIAWALRAALKVTIIGIGLVLAILLGLQYAGVMEVDWSMIGRHYDSVADWVARHAGSVKNFVTGHLPSAGSAVAGFVVGFRRK